MYEDRLATLIPVIVLAANGRGKNKGTKNVNSKYSLGCCDVPNLKSMYDDRLATLIPIIVLATNGREKKKARRTSDYHSKYSLGCCDVPNL